MILSDPGRSAAIQPYGGNGPCYPSRDRRRDRSCMETFTRFPSTYRNGSDLHNARSWSQPPLKISGDIPKSEAERNRTFLRIQLQLFQAQVRSSQQNLPFRSPVPNVIGKQRSNG